MLEARELARRKPGAEQWLLDHVSLRLAAAERVAIAGPSAAGKSLLLRALALLDPRDGGDLLWQGASLRAAEIPRYRTQVMYVPQRPSAIAETVEASLRLPFSLAAHRSRHYDAERITGWLTRLGRDARFLASETSHLSGGESQIVALLRALQLDPRVLLLDEPTAALDPVASGAVERLLCEWIAERPAERALVWISHDARQAARIATRIVLMEAGQIVADRENHARNAEHVGAAHPTEGEAPAESANRSPRVPFAEHGPFSPGEEQTR